MKTDTAAATDVAAVAFVSGGRGVDVAADNVFIARSNRLGMRLSLIDG